jgi:hypothetical protein
MRRKEGRNKAEGALRPNKPGVGRAGLAVIFNMGLGRFPRVVRCVGLWKPINFGQCASRTAARNSLSRVQNSDGRSRRMRQESSLFD